MSSSSTPAVQTTYPTVTDRVNECLERINKQNDKWHAISQLFSEEARAKARELDEQVAAGQLPAKLHGLPIVVKELMDLQGLPTPFGSRAYGAVPASRNAPVIDLLSREGAVLLGTTHMVEFAIGSWGTNYVKGTPWNPADPDIHRVPGGSSSGSAVAVAAGLVPAAIGSDTGGSIRIPASLCGVIGFKPSYGIISTKGVAPLGPTFDTLGPITRNIADARRLTEAMSGQSLTHAPVSLQGLRVAVVAREALQPIDPEVESAFHNALERLKELGAVIEVIELPLAFTEFQRLNGNIVAYEIYRHISALADNPKAEIDGHIRSRVLAGAKISPQQHQQNLDELSQIKLSFNEVFSDFDLLVLPGTPIPACPLSEVDENQIPMSRYTRVANCLDLCAISLPLSRTKTGLPVGWQLCASARTDAYLLAVAEQLGKDDILGREIQKMARVEG